MLDVSQVVSLLAALGLGSLFTQYASKSHERRTVRAEVLAALGAVERARISESDRFHDAAMELQIKALIARAPRQVVVRYLAYAEAAWYFKPVEEQTESEFCQPVVSFQAALVAAELVSWTMWHPFWFRLTSVAKRLERLDVAITDLYSAVLDERHPREAWLHQRDLRDLQMTNDARRRNGLKPLLVRAA